MNLAALRTKVLNRLVGVSSEVSEEVDQLINWALRDAQDDHNFQVMRAETTANTTTASHTLVATLPSNWKEPRGRAYYTTMAGDEQFLEYLPDEEDMVKEFDTSDPNDLGQPKSLRVRMTSDVGARELLVFPFPDGESDWTSAPVGEYRVTIPYWKYLADLAIDGDENWFTIYGPQYVIAQATAHGFLLDWDEQRAAGWLQLGAKWMTRLKRLDAGGQMSPAGFLHVRTDVYGRRDQGRL